MLPCLHVYDMTKEFKLMMATINDHVASRFVSHKTMLTIFKGHWIANNLYPGLSS